MILSLIVLSLIGALVSAFAACTATNAKKVLWGSLATTIGIGLSVELALKGYLGMLVISVFLVADVVLYLFLRTQQLLPNEEVGTRRTDIVYRVSMLWVVLCSCVAGAYWIFSQEFRSFPAPDSAVRISALYEKLWGSDWILILAILFSLTVLVTGGFFLVRKGEE